MIQRERELVIMQEHVQTITPQTHVGALHSDFHYPVSAAIKLSPIWQTEEDSSWQIVYSRN